MFRFLKRVFRSRSRSPRVRPQRRQARPRLELLEDRRLLSVAADFNGDGFDDLAIGVPGEDINGQTDAGAVNVIYGSYSAGLTSGLRDLSIPDNQFWHQDSVWGGLAVLDVAEAGDRFGSSLAAGDFNGDGYDDLAIGVPDEGINRGSTLMPNVVPGAGAVHVLYGSAVGLTATGNQFWHQDSRTSQLEMPSDPAPGDHFGSSLAAGNFDGWSGDDLAIGVPMDLASEAGAVHVLYSGPGSSGLKLDWNQYWHQDSVIDGIAVAGEAEHNDLFGHSLAVGNFDGWGGDDLAIGVPFESVNGKGRAGAVHVLYSGDGTVGLTAEANQFWHQDRPGIQDSAEGDDTFGISLAVGNFDGWGGDDLAVGVPGESFVGGSSLYNLRAGAVNILYSGDGTVGLTAAWNQFWHQDSPNIRGSAEIDDRFGSSLAAGNFDNWSGDDLAIGVPGDSINGKRSAGGVNVLYSGDGTVGLTAAENQFWSQDVVVSGIEVLGVAEVDDYFGASLTVGNFDGWSGDDLAIGVPGDNVNGKVNAGAVNVLYSHYGTSGLHAEWNQYWHQDVVGIADALEDGDGFGSF